MSLNIQRPISIVFPQAGASGKIFVKRPLRLLAFFDLAFLEDNVLTHARIVFLQFKLLGVLGVLLRDVENARPFRANQLDIVLGLGHGLIRFTWFKAAVHRLPTT